MTESRQYFWTYNIYKIVIRKNTPTTSTYGLFFPITNKHFNFNINVSENSI